MELSSADVNSLSYLWSAMDKIQEKVELNSHAARLFLEPYIDVHTAASVGDCDIIMQVIESENKSMLWRKNANGWSPFMYACYNDHVELVKLMVAHGVHKFDFNKDGVTPLMYAALNGNTEIMSLLYEPITINMVDKKGWTALFYAISRRRESAVKLLLQYGANVNIIDHERGYSALLLAASSGKTSIVKMLLEAGANPSLVSWDGETAITIAHTKGSFEIVRMLSSNARPCEFPLLSLHNLLSTLGLENHYSSFQKRNIDIDSFFMLNEDNLRNIGINIVGQRKRIFSVISKWHQNRKQQERHAASCNSCRTMYM